MTRNQLLRRVAILCCHCLRNIAYYKRGWWDAELIYKDQFWTTVNGNFLDISIIEWCKLFGDSRGKHYWGKVITEKDKFIIGLLKTLNLTEEEFDSYINKVRTYRDKFVAHLDSENTAHLPMLDVAKNSTIYLYDYLRENEDRDGCFPDAPRNAKEYYQQKSKEGKAVYNN